MKKIYFFLVVLLLISSPVFASPAADRIDQSAPDIDPIFESELLLQQIDTPEAESSPQQPVETTVIPELQLSVPYLPMAAPLALDTEPFLSGTLHYSRLRDRGLLPDPVSGPLGGQTIGTEAVGYMLSILSISPSYNMTSDGNQDVEPSVMVYNSNGTIYKTTSYIKILSNTNYDPRIYSSTTSNYVNPSNQQLPLPIRFARSADPMISKNAYSSGVAPGRIYTSGMLYNKKGTSGNYGIPNAIATWYSNNGGVSWSQPVIVIENTTDNMDTADKPAITVSWHTGTLGYVYVGYVYIDTKTSPATYYILVSRSTDGGLTFPQISLVVTATQNYVNGVQVLVNKNNGQVYVLWTDLTANSIKMSMSQDFGVSWGQPETIPGTTGKIVYPHYDVSNKELGFLKCSGSTNGLRAPSFPMARFNWVANKISVVWHEWEQGSLPNCNSLPPGSAGCNTDVYYTARSSSGTWQNKVRINDNQQGDQFLPALDFDRSGNLVVTFYDRRDDGNNILYHEYMARIDSSGNPLQSNTRVSASQTDPRSYTQYPCFIGDYQDIWEQTISNTDKFFSSRVGITNAVGDIYISEIVP